MELPLLDTDLKFFTVNQREYVLDIPSSTLFEIHPSLRKVLERSVRNFSTDYLDELKRDFHFMDWMEMVGELKHMIDHRYLTIYASRITPYELKEQKINSIMLNVCHDCNMRCTYCYQKDGTFGKEPEYMSKEVASRAVEFLFKESPDSRVFINISGGEPLLNPDLVRSVILLARENEEKYEKEVVITLSTNGSLLDKEMLQFLKREKVELIIPLDGGTEEQNQMRLMGNRRPSVELVRDRLNWVKESGIGYRVKGIVHHMNISDFEQLLSIFRQEAYARVSFEPIIARPDAPYALSQRDIEQLKGHVARLFEQYSQGDAFSERISNLHSVIRSISSQTNQGYTCGAGKNYLCVTPKGDLYPCHLLVGHSEFLLGNLFTGTLDRDKRKEFYQPLHVLNRESCRTCWARYFCGGGCVGENYLAMNHLATPYPARCQLVRLCTETAIQVYCSRLQAEERLEVTSERRKSGREIYKIS